MTGISAYHNPFAEIASVTNLAGPEAGPARVRIAVAIPCYNEAAAIATVIAQFKAALPDAEIVVFDNNSTDRTGDIARGLGVRVVHVARQGKGHAVRAAFATLAESDVLVLTDGDGTYPADAAPLLVAPVLEETAEMAVGARQPIAGGGAMSLTRGLGNRLIRAAFRVLIGPGNTDLLSGYRAFSKRYRAEVHLRSSGFEIETELASEAVARKLRVVEISVPYYPRIAGTQSKLRAARDGLRILATIVNQSWAHRTWRTIVVFFVPFGVLMVTINRWFWVAEALSVVAMLCLVMIDHRTRPYQESSQNER
jgi:glycosyltransferase involved in cell wall biosynthesis